MMMMVVALAFGVGLFLGSAPGFADAGAPPAGASLPDKAEHRPMIRIPAGQFVMGSTRSPEERPAHRVSVAAFELDATEVTTGAYQLCVAAGRCKPTVRWKTCNLAQPGKDLHPINCLDWRQAEAFCKWAGKRLPTEEEWEYAARGTDGRSFPWGNGPAEGRVCWKRAAGKQGTCPVATFPTGDSPLGLHDMAGNVWEWTASGFSRSYAHKRVTALKVSRGGGWGDVDPASLRTTTRGRWNPEEGADVVGFRCAR
jgi:formylglycine-generating enzyme required for sulfatase activity